MQPPPALIQEQMLYESLQGMEHAQTPQGTWQQDQSDGQVCSRNQRMLPPTRHCSAQSREKRGHF